MQVLDTDSWIPTPTAPTRVRQVAAGVSTKAAVQITNNTLWNLCLNDGPTPPLGIGDAKFVIPPRSTANFPLASGACAVRWLGTLSVSSDLITFVYSDDVVAPNVTPGVQAAGAIGAPIQSLLLNNTLGPIAFPQLLQTTSGLNIGAVHVYNSSNVLLSIRQHFTLTTITEIRPYTWQTLFLNVASGFAEIMGPVSPNLLASDSIVISWCDVNFPDAFPMGAGELSNPYRSPMVTASTLASPANNQIEFYGIAILPGTYTLYTQPVAGAPIVITYMSLICSGSNALGLISLSGGLDGQSALTRLHANRSTGAVNSLARSDNVLVENQGAGNNVLQLEAAGTITTVEVVIGAFKVL